MPSHGGAEPGSGALSDVQGSEGSNDARGARGHRVGVYNFEPAVAVGFPVLVVGLTEVHARVLRDDILKLEPMPRVLNDGGGDGLGHRGFSVDAFRRLDQLVVLHPQHLHGLASVQSDSQSERVPVQGCVVLQGLGEVWCRAPVMVVLNRHLAGALGPAPVADDHAGVGAGVITGDAGQLQRG